MAVTVKQLAKQWHVTRQAIRARITRTKGFKSNYTKLHHHTRFIDDDGVNILKKHSNNNSSIKKRTENSLLRIKNKALENEVHDLRVSNRRLYGIASREQNLNIQLNYYRNTNWLERLFGKKPTKQPKLIEPNDPKGNK